jgi:hypothetical protein
MTPVTQAVSLAISCLKRDQPTVRLIVSYADERQGHLGKVYQAGNWVYTGLAIGAEQRWIINGQEMHPRSVVAKFGTQATDWIRENVDPAAHKVKLQPKHRYVYPLDKAMRRQVNKLAIPYPRGLSVDGDTPSDQDGKAGSTPADRSIFVQNDAANGSMGQETLFGDLVQTESA